VINDLKKGKDKAYSQLFAKANKLVILKNENENLQRKVKEMEELLLKQGFNNYDDKPN